MKKLSYKELYTLLETKKNNPLLTTRWSCYVNNSLGDDTHILCANGCTFTFNNQCLIGTSGRCTKDIVYKSLLKKIPYSFFFSGEENVSNS